MWIQCYRCNIRMFKDPYLDFAFRWRCSGALFGSRIHILAVKTLFHQHFAVPVQSQFCLGVFSETAHIYRITRTKYLLIEVWIHLSVLIFISLKLPNFLFLVRTCGTGSRLEKSNLCRGLLIDRGAAFSLMVEVENSDLKVTEVSDVLFMLCHVSFLKK